MKKIWLWPFRIFSEGGQKICRASRANSQKNRLCSRGARGVHKMFRALCAQIYQTAIFWLPPPGKILYPPLYGISYYWHCMYIESLTQTKLLKYHVFNVGSCNINTQLLGARKK